MFNFLKNLKKECGSYENTEAIEASAINPKPIRTVIGELLYDTSKADRLCKYCVENDTVSAPGMKVGEYYFGILFRTHKGRFFIQQHGKLYPCNDLVAKNILKDFPDEYQEIFGKVEDA